MYRIAGESDLAAWDAQRVLELEPASARGLLALGACSEATGDFEQADLLYGQALDRLATWDATTLRGDALLDVPSGRLLIRAARRMLAVRRPRSALAIVDAALRSEIRGPGHYPEAEAYEVRADALERLEPVPREDVSAAALEAGGVMCGTDGRTSRSRCCAGPSTIAPAPTSPWLLADALVSMQDPDAPDPEITKEALDVWTEWRKSYGPPEGAMAWAYVTRALIEEDLGRQAGPGDREHSWEALGNVERALVEDDGHALRWALRARYTQELGLLEDRRGGTRPRRPARCRPAGDPHGAGEAARGARSPRRGRPRGRPHRRALGSPRGADGDPRLHRAPPGPRSRRHPLDRDGAARARRGRLPPVARKLPARRRRPRRSQARVRRGAGRAVGHTAAAAAGLVRGRRAAAGPRARQRGVGRPRLGGAGHRGAHRLRRARRGPGVSAARAGDRGDDGAPRPA